MGINKIRGIFFDSYWGHYTRIQKIILISLLITSLHSFVVSLGDAKQYAGVDLRNKVVGARYLLAGLDPYAIEQNPPSEWFIDPQRHYPGRSRTTVTPLVLMAYCPFAWLPYSTQRIIWALIEWFTMILCILVLMRIVPKGNAEFVFLVFALLFFISGFFWRLHVERGQYYILLTLILSLAIFFDTKQKSILGAILLGLLAILRPTFLIIIPLLLLLRKWKKAGIMALASLAIFALSLLGSNIQLWNSYFTNVYFIERGFANKQNSEANLGMNNIPPHSAEGVNFHNMIRPPWVPLSSLEVLTQFSKRIHNIPPVLIWQLNKFAGVCFIVYCFCMAFFIGKYPFNQRFLWIFIIAMVLNVDYFTPFRWAYNDILFLPAIALLAPLLVSPFISMIFQLTITCAFLWSYDHTLSLFGFPVANVVRSVLFMSALNIFIISCVFKKMLRSWR
jgi:hypothetical protein